MNTQPLIIVQRELEILKRSLQDAVLTDLNTKNLLSELANAKIVEERELPDDAIGLNTVVHLRERPLSMDVRSYFFIYLKS
jgi:regulator of nucleoside diphosphate kinase